MRLVVIRELVRKGEKPRKELKLLSVQEDLYNYQVIAANSKAPGEKVWRVYNKRACCLPVRGTQTGENLSRRALRIRSGQEYYEALGRCQALFRIGHAGL